MGIPRILYIKAQNKFCRILDIVTLLNLIASTTDLILEPTKVISEASIATSVPLPKAIPTSAAVKAYADGLSGSNSFSTIAVSGQSNVVASSSWWLDGVNNVYPSKGSIDATEKNIISNNLTMQQYTKSKNAKK